MKINPRKGMPTQRSIREFWGNTSLWRFKNFDSRFEFMEDDYCFACGFTNGEGKTERSHIVALSLGGSNQCENLHLLCSRCHIDSENLGMPANDTHQASYWRWFFSRTYNDRCMSAALAQGFNYRDFDNLKALQNATKEIFACRSEILSRLGIN